MSAAAVDDAPFPPLALDLHTSVEHLLGDPRRARIAGATLGAAIGDAMGHPTEFLRSWDDLRAAFGPEGVRGYALRWERDGRRFAPYTDDTQLAEIVHRALLVARRDALDLDATMRTIAEGLVRWRHAPQGGHRAPGSACLAGAAALAAGTPWDEAGGATAGGCGSVMRAHPFGLVFADDPVRAEAWAVAHSRLTHRDPIALAACAAMAVGVAASLAGDGWPETAAAMVAAAARHDAATAAMIEAAVDDARRGADPEDVLDRLEGWAAHEAIAAAAYVVTLHPDAPRDAILRAANSPGDSDSIATLAGALTGARAGLAALPRPWVDELERVEVFLALAAAT